MPVPPIALPSPVATLSGPAISLASGPAGRYRPPLRPSLPPESIGWPLPRQFVPES